MNTDAASEAGRPARDDAPLTLARFAALPDAQRTDAVVDDQRSNKEVLTALGDECERQAAADPVIARALGESIAMVARGLLEFSANARALRATIPALAYAGQLTEALARATDAQVAATIAGDEVEHARARVASMHALAKLGRTDEALATGRAARDTLRGAARADLAARAELNLANIHKLRGEHTDALACLTRALDGVAHNEPVARGTIENTLGETYLQLDDFAAAHAAFTRAEPLVATLPLAHAVVLGNRADLLARTGRLGEALRDFELAAVAVRDLAPGHHARLLIERAEALAALGAHREALAALDSALVVSADKGLKSEMTRGFLVRARSLAAVERSIEAEHDATRAHRLANECGDARSVRAAALMRSELAFARGDSASAAEFAILAATNASPLEDIRATLCTARARLAQGDPAAALGDAKECAARARLLGVDVVEIDAALTAAACERALGRSEDAIDTLTRAVELAEDVRSRLAADAHRAAFSASRLRIYEDLALELLAQPTNERLARAFETIERARSRTLLDAMLHALDRRQEPFTDELAMLRARLSALQSVIVRDATEPGERRSDTTRTPRAVEALQGMRVLDQELDALLTTSQIRRGAHEFLARPLAARDALAALDPSDALITYFAAGDELLVLVGMRGELSCLRALISASELDTLVEKYLFQLRAGTRNDAATLPSRALVALSRALYRALLAPLFHSRAELNEAQRLIIVPHGSLHALPFASLHDGERSLIERVEVQMAPSASIACDRSRARKNDAAHSAIVIGVADEAAPLIAQEVDALCSTLHCESLTGSNATRAAVRAAVRDARVVHFACHGRFIASLPSASGLRLHDGWLSIADLLDLHLNAELVFLSGCETGRYAIDAADELRGITRALLAAGAARLVTTLWVVRDASAAKFATTFYTEFSRGIRPSTALRVAMLDLMRHSPHPSYWAPFVVTGVL